MQNPDHNRSITQSHRGFTLLELLAVVSVLAIMAGAVIFSFSDDSSNANSIAATVSSHEAKSVEKAFLAFYQDTGFYPKQGPFALTTNGGEIDPSNASHWPSFLEDYGINTVQERTDWFNHPGNMYQVILQESPLQGTSHVLRQFRPESGLGWNGPYISDGPGLVVVESSVYNPSEPSHVHTPSSWGSDGKTWNGKIGPKVTYIPVICDSFTGPAGSFQTRQFNEEGLPISERRLLSIGRPFFYLFSNSMADDSASSWVVCFGSDRTFQGGSNSSDDIVIYLPR